MGYKTTGKRSIKATSAVSSSSVSFNNPTNDGLIISGSNTDNGNMVHSLTPVSGSSNYDVDVPTLLGGTTSGMYIRKIVVTDSSYNDMDDLAIPLTGGYVKIIGTLFTSNATVYFNGALVSSTYVSATEVRAVIPATSTGLYQIVVVDSAKAAMYIPGLRVSGFPGWNVTSYDSLGATVNAQLVGFGDAPLTYRIVSGSLPAGVTMDINGAITGTVSTESNVTLTVIVDDAQLQSTQATITISFRLNDPKFSQVPFVINNESSNGATNNAILDGARGAFVTKYGTPTQGSVSPFGNDWSVYFNGSTDYLGITDNAVLQMGTGDFTIEAWVCPSLAPSAQRRIWSYQNSGSSTVLNLYQLSTGQFSGDLRSSSGTGSSSLAGTTVAAANNWYHVAFVRTGTTTYLFVNGVQEATLTGQNQNLGAGLPYVGGSTANGNPFPGYISNIRVSKGLAVYTSNFTPNTAPLTVTANTSFLSCASNRMIDKSTNNLVISQAGTPAVKHFNPFGNELTAYTKASTAGSTYFAGTGSNVADYLTTANSVANFGASNFTAECWVNFKTVSAGYQPILANSGSANQQGWLLYMDTTNKLSFQVSTDNTVWAAGLVSTFTPTVNTWTHIALVRNGTTITLYANGSSIGSVAYGGTIGTVSNSFRIGHYAFFGGATARSFAGYISDVRLNNGNATYTANFTPSISQLMPMSGTSLLTCQNSQSVLVDKSGNNVAITATGTPSPSLNLGYTVLDTSTAATKFGGSMYFNGSTDNVIVADDTATMLGGGTWSAECWVYCTSSATASSFLAKRDVNTSTGAITIVWNTDNSLALYCSSNGSTWDIIAGNSIGTCRTNEWNHIAVSRSGNVISAFINGVRTFALGGVGAVNLSNAAQMHIGGDNGPTIVGPFTGYISNVRTLNGAIAYDPNAGSLTVPTAPLTKITGTTMLMNGTNAGLIDASMNNNIATNSTVQVANTNVKYGSFSAKFNGTSDYLSIPANSTMTLGTGDFTIEGWFYPTATTGSRPQGMMCSQTSGNAGWVLGHFSGNWAFSSYSTAIVNGGTATLNSWQHVAAVRSAGVTTLYVNGTSVGTSSAAFNFTDLVDTTIGRAAVTAFYTGSIDDLRITKGYARYVGNFTAPGFPFAGQ